MSEKKDIVKDIENPKAEPNVLLNSTEQTVCAPEFPSGCIDLEDDEA